MIAGTQMATKRDKFQFSNAQAQAAEARLNAKEAEQLCAKWLPKHLKEMPEEATTPAGACFRKVMALLPKGRGK